MRYAAGLGLAVALTLGGAGCSRSAERPAAKNLVVILIDTLRQDRLSAYGYPRLTSPRIDEVARRGVRLDGVAPSPWTKPSTATLLTGLHPLRHQAIGESDVIPDEARTLAELLQSEGFDTLGVVTNGWVSRAWGFQRGFAQYFYLPKMGFGRFPKSADVNSVLLPKIAGLREPFFLYVHYLDPHMPYEPPYQWDGSPLPPDLAELSPFTREKIGDLGPASQPQALISRASELYDGEVRANDFAVGELMDQLEARGALANSVVVITSDHGEEFLEHGRVGHGKALYQESVAVPLIVSAPCCIAGGTSLGATSLVDVVPTVLELLARAPELPPGYGFDGVSFADLLRDPAAKRQGRERDILLHLDLDSDGTAGVGLRRGRNKLLLGKKPYAKELFDLSADAVEKRDLFGESSLATTSVELSQAIAAQFNEKVKRALPRHTTAADSELVAEIQALGYINTFSERSGRRLLPRRLREPDRRAGGFRGWEDLSNPSACFAMTEAPAAQLLSGWFEFESGLPSRWTAPRATLALPASVASGPSILELRGTNYRPEAHRVRVSWSGGPGTEFRLDPGPFTITSQLDPAANLDDGFGLIELSSEPPFRPREHGSADDRILGVNLTHVCLRSVTAADQRR